VNWLCILASVTFRYLQLLFPILVALHNAEEAIGLPQWAQRTGLPFGAVRPAVFRFAVVVFTALALAVTTLSAVFGGMTLWGNLTFGYIIAVLLNALVPHIAVSIVKRTLMPGVITAAVLNLPILSFLAVLALKQGYVSSHDAAVYSIVVPILLLLMMLLLFKREGAPAV
jgi:hypothetical protein